MLPNVKAENHILTLEARLIDLVPETGSVGNVTLLRMLTEEGWSEEQYWEIRNRLMERGVLATGRGRGGSVKRAGTGPQAEGFTSSGAPVLESTPTLGADVLELPVANGGRLILVVQGRPAKADIDKLYGLLVARFPEIDLDSNASASLTVADPYIHPPTREAPDDMDFGDFGIQEEDGDGGISMACPELSPERRARRSEDIEALCVRLIQSLRLRSNLTRAQAIIVARYGLGHEDEQTLEAVGNRYDITREMVRQIEARVLAQWAGNPGLTQQARDVLSRWMQGIALASPTGALLASRSLEALREDRNAVDGWVRLALDVAFPASGAGKLGKQLVDLADLALHRYSPFGVDCWIADPHRASDMFPNVEAWLEELVASKQALPLPADTFASVLGVDVADVIAVAAAHPRFSVYAGYLFRGAAATVNKRAVRAHLLALHLSPGAAPISQLDLWKGYRQRFTDIDPCSPNDLRVALSDKQRGAPHLFVLDNNNSIFALGGAASLHGLDLTVRFPAPEPAGLDQSIAPLVEALRQGPATAEALAERFDMEPQNLISQLGQRSDFISVTPRYYGLADQAQQIAVMAWKPQDLIEEDALAIIGCRQAGDPPEAIYAGWTSAYEQALCIRAQDSSWACFSQLLWACEPEHWPMPESEKAGWCALKSARGQPPQAVSLPTGNRLPDAERLLRFLLVVRQQGAISMAMANRVTRPRGPLQQINGTLLAMLARVGALQDDAGSYWAKHRAGPDAERWYALLTDEYLQNGKLGWSQGVCLALLQEAVSNPGQGWASGQDWTKRIRNWGAESGVDVAALAAQAASGNEADEAQGAPAEGDDPDLAMDLLPAGGDNDPAGGTSPAEQPNEGEAARQAEELAQLVSEATRHEGGATEAPSLSHAQVSTVESIAVLVAKAQAGDAVAQYRLARQLEEGVGAAPNPQAMVYWLQRAADARYVPACVRLGRLLLSGAVGNSTREERQQGLVYLNAGTKAGNATACYLVALEYRDGGLTRKNPQAAMRLLKRAARAGHGRAAYALALMLRERMDRWVPDTLKLLRLAAGKGVPEASKILAQAGEGR